MPISQLLKKKPYMTENARHHVDYQLDGRQCNRLLNNL